MSALAKKLLRESRHLLGQIVTIAVVLGGGIMCFISLRGTMLALGDARDDYYDERRFGHVFANVERAPESIASRIEALPGVAVVETRIAENVSLPIEGMDRPALGRLLSLPESGVTKTNALALIRGRFPERGRDEVVVLDSFARAHGLEPDQTLPAVINGKLRKLRVVGVAMSPEFIYAIRPGAMMDDPQRYGVLWMERGTLSSAYGLDGAFNDITVRVQPGASVAEVRAQMDRILQPYGNDGCVARDRQISNYILSGELSQLGAIAGMVPMVFLAVAAFLMNMVLGRMVALQRPVIASLKALGYTNGEITQHFLGLVAIVMVPGSILGVAGGSYLGGVVTNLYASVFRIPNLAFHLTPSLVIGAIGSSGLAAVIGALFAVRTAVKLPPAEAMRPPAPARYRRTLVERVGLAKLLGPSGMMVMRELQRRPLRVTLSALGMGGAIALIVFGHFGLDSFTAYFEGSLAREQRQDLAVTFARPLSPRAIREIGAMPGVVRVEGMRAVPIRVRREHHVRDSVLMGLPERSELRRVIDRSDRIVDVADEGVLLSRVLGEVLGANVGDRIDIELREGDRRTVRPVIVGFVDDTTGLQIYAPSSLIGALEDDNGAVSAAMIQTDPDEVARLEERLRRSPSVMDVADLHSDMDRMLAQNASMMNVWTAISITLSAAIIFGVVYNNARIALTMRSRELASLRVLGMSRREISGILIWGLAIEVALAIPIGLVLGRTWSGYFMTMVDPEQFRWSTYVAPLTYFMAAATAVLAGAASAMLVRRSLDRLDLIGVLKTRE